MFWRGPGQDSRFARAGEVSQVESCSPFQDSKVESCSPKLNPGPGTLIPKLGKYDLEKGKASGSLHKSVNSDTAVAVGVTASGDITLGAEYVPETPTPKPLLVALRLVPRTSEPYTLNPLRLAPKTSPAHTHTHTHGRALEFRALELRGRVCVSYASCSTSHLLCL